MRRWHLLNRLLRAPAPRAGDRCVLVVEELEAREVLTPVVFAPTFFVPRTFENGAFTFTSSTSSAFFASDVDNTGQPYTAALTATNGTISLDESLASSFGLTVANNGTATVTLGGQLNDINSFLSVGFDYNPTAFYSGEATVGMSVTDPATSENGSDSVLVQVSPVASPASLSVVSGEIGALSAPFVIPPGFVSVTGWPDADGSETATITFSLDAPDPSLFALSAGGVPLAPVEPGLWQITATSQAELQALLDSLVLTPPPGFTGSAFLAVFGTIRDTADFPSLESSESDTADLGFGELDLRFFIGATVALPPVSGPEGGTLDLGGQFVASDPDEQPGDSHVLTFSVPAGTFTFNSAALVEGMTANSIAGSDGSTTITLAGDLAAINLFLAASGSLLYEAPDANFSGAVPLAVTLANLPNGPSGGEAPGKFFGGTDLTFAPVASPVFPTATDAVTDQDTPVAITIGLSALPTDPSESVLVLIENVPAGASFNRGTDLGGGTWALSPADLDGLVFTPPPGAIGTYLLIVKAIVTDSEPELELSDIATAIAPFVVIVNPVGAPPPPTPTDDPDPTTPDPTDPAPQPNLFLDIDFDDEDDISADPINEDVTPDATGTEVSADTGDDETDRPDEMEERPPVLLEAFGASIPLGPVFGPTETRVGFSPPGLGSLFAQPEVPLPTYGGNEKHPLPPVLPLDQSSPVAGFTESGGDSFALIDKLYRDGAAQRIDLPPAEAATATPARATAGTKNQTVAVPAPGAAPGPEAEPADEEWRLWVAGTAIVSAVAAWAWLSRSPNGVLARIIRRLFHPARRPAPTEAC